MSISASNVAKQISVIIVSYNNDLLIDNCIKTIAQFERQTSYEIIVVDNGSTDNCEEVCQKLHVKFIKSEGNIGFAKANNIGVKAAIGEFILFLNPDTLFIEPVLEKCVAEFERNDKVGALGCRLLNIDGSLQLSYHDGHQIFKKLWWRNPLVIKFLKGAQKAKKSMALIKEKHQNYHTFDWLCGAFVMMRKADIEKYELHWDEDFFMYWEDVELGIRIRKKGMRNIYFPDVSIIHIGGGGENVPLRRYNIMERSKYLFIKKTKGKLFEEVYKILFRLQLHFEWILYKRSNNDKNLSPYFLNELDYYHVR